MKKFLYTLIVVVAVYFSGNAQVANVVIENQTISGTYNAEATTSITIKPTTLIQSGSTFTAMIINPLESRPVFPVYGSVTFSNQNYIFTRSYQKAMSSFSSGSAKEGDVIENIVYYDGLGRPMQQIGIKSSPNYEDLVTHVGYDSYGRMDKEWLPYEETTGSLGAHRGDISSDTQSFYKNKFPTDFQNLSGSGVNAYAQKEFEASPLNRLLKQAAPGEDWKLGQGHEIGTDYETNTGTEVLDFGVDLNYANYTYTPTLVENGFYGRGALYKNVMKDENHDGSASKLHTTEQFIDKRGQMVLKRTYAPFDLNGDGDTSDTGEAEAKHDTYYVYDDFGNLTYVIPPKASTTTTTSTPYSYSQSIYFSDFVFSEQGQPVQGGGSMSIGIENSTLQVVFNAGFENAIIDVSKTYPINAISPVPDMVVGYLDVDGSTNRYTIFVENDELKFLDNIPSAPAFRGFVQTLTASLDSGVFGTIDQEEIDVSSTKMDNLWYQYIYDDHNRLVEKKLPDKGWEYIVYNRLDQPVMTQDALLREKSPDQWLFTKYDDFGRVAYSGIYESNNDRVTLQIILGGTTIVYEERSQTGISVGGKTIYYTNGSFPTTSILETLTVNYYDSYVDADGLSVPGTVYGVTPTTNLKGLPTVSKTKVLEQNQWITAITGYDNKGRAIYAATKNNYLNTTDMVETELDFAGKVLETTTTHKKTGKSDLVTIDYFTYDHEGRLKSQQQSINNGGYVTLMENTYDNIGQLASKEIGEGLQNVDYAYNVRGWLKQINDPSSLGSDLFAFGINYNTVSHSGTALYNGNISETEWRTANTDNALKWYRYGYDPLNRITSATASSANYHLSSVSYDKNGNILTLNRKGHTNSGATTFGTMDDLVYTYDSGNKLTKVLDNGNDDYGFKDLVNQTTEYTYDANSNMVSDANKGITSINYNHLNLPTSIVTGSGTISYVYDAAGTKLQKTAGSSVTDYAGNYIYQDGNLQFFSHPEGYVHPDGQGGYDYVYQYKDHLGNVRLSYTDDPSNPGTPTIIEENNYYPFGLKHKGYNAGGDNSLGNDLAQMWKFGGKEFDESLSLETYDFGGRHYMPDIGRWGSLDPLAEFMRNQSPFNYGFNNPIYFSDYAGTIPWPVPEMFKNWTRKIDSWFGPRGKRNHNGLDINFSGGGNTDKGAPVVATHTGRVVMVKTTTDGRAGRYIEIESPDGSFKTRYLHLSSTTVAEGDEISEGQSIGLLGGSGFGKELGYTAHLHYEIHKKDMSGNFVPYNPTEGRGNSAANIVDPQSWIPQMGPFRNAEAYNFGSSWSIFDVPFLASGQETQSGSSDSGSSSSNGSSTTRDPISPVPVTPQPITPLPVTPPSGGTVIIPPVTPAPLPVIIPPRPPDSGF